MAESASRKAKILHLHNILLSETDDDHGLTMHQLIEHLQKRGISAERKAIYDDLDTLANFGVDIINRKNPLTEYAIGHRQFELPELLLLIDAVQSSRFLTKTKSDALVAKLQSLTSRHQKQALAKSMHVEGRIKTQNESIYYNIDTIQDAIRRKRKIEFNYLEYGLDKKAVLRRKGKLYRENPIALVYKDDFYYLITYNDKHEDFVRYRVDRMVAINETADPVPRLKAIERFDVQGFVKQTFAMFGGESVKVTLTVSRSVIGSIIDRFGKEVMIDTIDDTAARVHVSVLKSNTFFGWLAQFNDEIMIESPESLATEYLDYLKGIVQLYEDKSQ